MEVQFLFKNFLYFFLHFYPHIHSISRLIFHSMVCAIFVCVAFIRVEWLIVCVDCNYFSILLECNGTFWHIRQLFPRISSKHDIIQYIIKRRPNKCMCICVLLFLLLVVVLVLLLCFFFLVFYKITLQWYFSCKVGQASVK